MPTMNVPENFNSMQITVAHNQTLADMALQGSGQLDVLVQLALLNGMGITDRLVPGQVVAAIAPLPPKRITALRLQLPDNLPASGDDFTGEATLPGGIGFMQVGNNFIVS